MSIDEEVALYPRRSYCHVRFQESKQQSRDVMVIVMTMKTANLQAKKSVKKMCAPTSKRAGMSCMPEEPMYKVIDSSGTK